MLTALIPLLLRKRLPKWLKVTLCAGMYAYLLSFAALSVYVMSYSDSADVAVFSDDKRFIVMVFGCRTYEKGPSRALANRLNAAYELLVRYPRSLCIVTGGQGDNEPITEAASMKRYLVGKGIPAERITEEAEASDTIENIENSAEIIRAAGWDDYAVVGVSTDFHLRRISILAGERDFDMMLIPAQTSDIISLTANLVREYMSFVKLICSKLL
jgi:uncharacterized SAM-binding protein YcdF (DUF218 family)